MSVATVNERLAALSVEEAEILFDFSKTHLDRAALDAFARLDSGEVFGKVAIDHLH